MESDTKYIIGILKDTQDCLRQYHNYSEEMKKIGRGFSPSSQYSNEYLRGLIDESILKMEAMEKTLELIRKDNLAVSRECVQLRKILSKHGIN